jgi:hypothetical protein
MNRITDKLWPIEALHGMESVRPAEALVLRRDGLIRILQNALFELHEQRRRLAGTPPEADTTHQIEYWQEVLAWVQDRRAADLVLMDRSMTEA